MSNELDPIVAGIGYNDGANGGFWRVQPRQKIGKEKGRWIEMGAELRAYFKDALGKIASVSGRAIGSDGTPDAVRVLIQGHSDKGIPDGIYRFNTKHVRVADALLSEEYLKSQGIDPNAIPSDIDVADLPKLSDLERADITSNDIRMANEGINSPEGQQMSQFKDSAEGKKTVAAEDAVSKEAGKPATPSTEKNVKDMTWEELHDIISTPVAVNDSEALNKYIAASNEFYYARGGYQSAEAQAWRDKQYGGNSTESVDKAVADAWDNATNGGSPTVDDLIVAARPPEGPKTKVAFDLNPGDKIQTNKGEKLTYVTHKENPKNTKENLLTFTKEDGSPVYLKAPKDFKFKMAPSEEKKPPVPKDDNMSPRQLDKLDKLKEEALNIGNLDPQLELDLNNLYDRIDNLDIINKAEADDMISRLQQHIKENKGKPSSTVKPSRYSPPEFVPKDRPDNGQMIELPKTPESELWGRKVLALRDPDGNLVYKYDPATGELGSTPAENPNSVLNALLEEYPNAVWTADGALLVERTKFQDPNGTEYQLESLIRRTDGNNFMVSYRITKPDGSVTEYISYDYRDSFSSIHGKKNGIMRMSAILKGDLPEDFLPTLRAKNAPEWKTYFGTGKFEDRLKYFRGKYESRATRESLQNDLARAQEKGREDEIALAKYNLELLDEFFGGDINLYRENATKQAMKFLTMDEIVDKFALGRFRLLNNDGTVQRSTVSGIYDSIKAGDFESVAHAFMELRGRLPSMVNNPDIAQRMLDRVRAGVKKYFPKENQTTLSALITNGYKHLTEAGAYNPDEFDAQSHASWDGRILGKHMLVEYENSEGEKSVGIVTSLIPSERSRKRLRGEQSPNIYEDYVTVVFKGQDGKIQKKSARIAAKQLKILDDTGISQEALDRMTIYNPNISGEEMRRLRFGDAYFIQQQARYSVMFPAGTDTIGDGRNPAIKDPNYYNTDTLAPGDYLYDSNGLPLGQIAGVRETTSADGEKGYNFAHVNADGEVRFTAMKAGEIRAPKPDMTKEDPNGDPTSDPGFTADPKDFADVGFDAGSIGSDYSSPENAMQSIVENQGVDNLNYVAASLGHLMKLLAARDAHQKDPSEEKKAAYKKALTTFYTELSKHKAATAKSENLDYTPGTVPGDDILSPEEVAQLNAKISATHKPFTKTDRKSSLPPAPTYDDVVAAMTDPQNKFNGKAPKGWKAVEPKAMVDKLVNDQKEFLSDIAKMYVPGEDGSTPEIPATLLDSLAKLLFVKQNIDRERKITAARYHHIRNSKGDLIKLLKSADGNGYPARAEDIQTVATVIDDLRGRLKLDKPIEYALLDSAEATRMGVQEGALGFARLGTMHGHTIVDRLDRFIAGMADEKPYDPKNSWWSVDLGTDPEKARQYVLYHEIGHLIEGLVWPGLPGPAALLRMRQEYQALYQEYISNYGRSDMHEHFAESMARWGLTGKASPKFIEFLINHGILVPNLNK